MSRTIKEIALKHDIDYTIDKIQMIFSKYKYQNKIVKGENVWIRGDGIFAVMECFGYSFTDSHIIIQAWIRDAITGESSLEGFKAMVSKKKMKSILEEIERTI